MKTDFDGKEALVICKDHPHYNSTAICLGADYTAIGWAMKFRNVNSNEEFYVFDGKKVSWKK